MATRRHWGKGPPASQPLMNNNFKRNTTLMMYHLSFCPVMGNRDRYQQKITSVNFKKQISGFNLGVWGFLFFFCPWAQEHCLFSSLNEKVRGTKRGRWQMWLHGHFLQSLLHLEKLEKITRFTQNKLMLCLALLPCWQVIFSLVCCTVSAILPTEQPSNRVWDPAPSAN